MRNELWVERVRSVRKYVNDLRKMVDEANEVCEGGDAVVCKVRYRNIILYVERGLEDFRVFEGPSIREVGAVLMDVLVAWRDYQNGLLDFTELRHTINDIINRAETVLRRLM